MKIKSFALLCCLALLSACKQGNSNTTDSPGSTKPERQTGVSFNVFKSDGSVQCEYEGIPLDTMAQELIRAGIDVICAQKGHDGLSRIAMCGATTGNINVYKIPVADLADAETLGFQPVSTLSEYTDQPCAE